MMRWDWVGDNSSEIRVEQKQRRRLRRQQQIEEADAMLDEAEIEDAALARAIPMVRENEHGNIESDGEEEVGNGNDILGVDDEGEAEHEYMEEDSSDDSEDADTSEGSDSESEASADSEEYAWGDHVGHRAFVYDDGSSSDSDESNSSENNEVSEGRRRRSAMVRARRTIVQMLRH